MEDEKPRPKMSLKDFLEFQEELSRSTPRNRKPLPRPRPQKPPVPPIDGGAVGGKAPADD